MLRKKTETDSPNLFSCLTPRVAFSSDRLVYHGHPTSISMEPLKNPCNLVFPELPDAILRIHAHLKPVLLGCHEIPDPTSHPEPAHYPFLPSRFLEENTHKRS